MRGYVLFVSRDARDALADHHQGVNVVGALVGFDHLQVAHVVICAFWTSCSTETTQGSQRTKTYLLLYEAELKDLYRAAHWVKVNWEDETAHRKLWLEIDLARTQMQHPAPGEKEERLGQLEKIIEADGDASLKFFTIRFYRDSARATASSIQKMNRMFDAALGTSELESPEAIDSKVNEAV